MNPLSQPIARLALATALVLPLAAQAGSAIEGDVTVNNNQAGNVTVRGGSGSVGVGFLRGGEIDLTATANVNSVVVKGGSINGTVSVTGNTAGDIDVFGGTANVNSVVVDSR